jgi:hypothetical protein
LKRILVTLVAELAVDLSTPRHQLRAILPERAGGCWADWHSRWRRGCLEPDNPRQNLGESFGILIPAARLIASQPRAVSPRWQGLHYLRDMFSGQAKLSPSNNDRYPKAPLDVRREKPLVTHQLTSSLTWQQLPEETQNCSF